MPTTRPCPTCGEPTPLTLAMTDSALVTYYRCQSCGCVWTVPKDNPDAEPHIVTKGQQRA